MGTNEYYGAAAYFDCMKDYIIKVYITHDCIPTPNIQYMCYTIDSRATESMG